MRFQGAKVAKDFEELTNWLYDLAQPGGLDPHRRGWGYLYCWGKPWSAEARNPPPDALCAAEGAPSAVLNFSPIFVEDGLERIPYGDNEDT